MNGRFTAVMMAGVFFGLVSCVQNQAEPDNNSANRPLARSVHGDSAGKNVTGGMAEVLKRATLPDFPSKTIGEALKGYRFFTKQEWREERIADGRVYVDFWGWFDAQGSGVSIFKSGVLKKGVGFKFLITRDGSFGLVMVSKLEQKTSGEISAVTVADFRGVLTKIYDNKEIEI